jgi:trk system potassium uptake protein
LADIPVLVIGLGRFGTALAETLSDLEHEVLGIDLDPELVQRSVDRLTHLIEADATNQEIMRPARGVQLQTRRGRHWRQH